MIIRWLEYIDFTMRIMNNPKVAPLGDPKGARAVPRMDLPDSKKTRGVFIIRSRLLREPFLFLRPFVFLHLPLFCVIIYLVVLCDKMPLAQAFRG